MAISEQEKVQHAEEHSWLRSHRVEDETRKRNLSKVWWGVVTAVAASLALGAGSMVLYAVKVFVERGGQ